MKLKGTKTEANLMAAFAGESQARNRYTIAASAAKKEGLYIIQDLFLYTADQERAHAKVFFDFLKSCNSDNIDISGGFPIANYPETIKNLGTFTVEIKLYEGIIAKLKLNVVA